MIEAGDNALRFLVYFHLEALPDTRQTKKIREHLRGSRNLAVRFVYEEAATRGLDLSTPSLHRVEASYSSSDQKNGQD